MYAEEGEINDTCSDPGVSSVEVGKASGLLCRLPSIDGDNIRDHDGVESRLNCQSSPYPTNMSSKDVNGHPDSSSTSGKRGVDIPP